MIGINTPPKDCVLTDMRDAIKIKRGKRKFRTGFALDRDMQPAVNGIAVEVRGETFSVLTKLWPIHVRAEQAGAVLDMLKDDAEVERDVWSATPTVV